MCAHHSRVSKSSSDLTHLSKKLAWVLRHGAGKCGLKLNSGGYLYVDELLNSGNLQQYSVNDVMNVVLNDPKNRFQTCKDVQSRLMIRATQGHTLQLNDDDLLTPIANAEEASTVVHGTSRLAWENIKTQGLKTMRRNHIHFAIGLPGESGVLSGMSNSSEIVIYLDVRKALRDGIKLFRSVNNVILSKGIGGVIPPEYFQKVVDRTGSDVLRVNQF